MPSGRLSSEMGEGCALQGRSWLREWGRAFLFLKAFGKSCQEGPAKAPTWAPLSLVIHSFNKYEVNTGSPCQVLGEFGQDRVWQTQLLPLKGREHRY